MGKVLEKIFSKKHLNFLQIKRCSTSINIIQENANQITPEIALTYVSGHYLKKIYIYDKEKLESLYIAGRNAK